MNRISMMSVLTVVFFFFVASMALPLFADAKGRKPYSDVPTQSAMKNPILTGFIKSVSTDSIVVLNKRYIISGVPLVKPSGEPALLDELKPGGKVSLYFKNRILAHILVYPYLAE